MKALNANNKAYPLADTPFAKGGEGKVFDIVGNGDFVAKLYHDKGQTREKEEKLRAMLAAPPQGTSGQIAWPCDILYKPNGQFWGFVMPRIQNVTKIDSLYSYDRRCEHPYAFYVQVAQNLCAAVSAVHESGHVCGDLNPANICVDAKTALVTLVDTDSYHIGGKAQAAPPPRIDNLFLGTHHQGRAVFKCPVCRPEYVPFEIQKIMNAHVSLREAKGETFTIYTDYFAVSIHIFALLMNGAHPYSCTVSGGVSASMFNLVSNIENGVFAYENNMQGIGAPKYAPDFSALPQNLQSLFLRTFGKNSFQNAQARPDVVQFHTALAQFESQLIRCNANSAHQYDRKNARCPLCEAENRMHTHSMYASKTAPAPNPLPKPKKNPPVSLHYLSKPILSPLESFLEKVGYVFGFLFGLALFVAFELFSLWLVQTYIVPLSVPVLSIALTLLILAVSPFIPMNLYNIAYVLLGLEDKTFFEGGAIVLNKTLFLTYVLYIGVMVYSFWGSPFSTLLNSFLICLLPTGVFKLLPFFTYDIMDTI